MLQAKETSQSETRNTLAAENEQLRNQLDQQDSKCEELNARVAVLEEELRERESLCLERQCALEAEQRKVQTRTAQYEHSKALTRELEADVRNREVFRVEQQKHLMDVRQALKDHQMTSEQTVIWESYVISHTYGLGYRSVYSRSNFKH